MPKPVVSIVKYRHPDASLREAIDLCDGFKGLRKEDKILIKPNIVGYEFDYPQPFGTLVTSAMMEALVRLLAENGFNNLTIGEGPLGAANEDLGQRVYAALGYGKLQERYGVKLIDFPYEKYIPIEFENNLKLNVAQSVLEADKIINFPVLKTHSLCKVSLGIKNIKGVLDRRSKEFCHGKAPEHDLELTFNQVLDKLPVALCVIDGVYSISRGPGPSGEAFRKNLVFASRDTYACDMVGAEVLGYKVADVPHLRIFAERHGLSMDLDSVEVRGESVASHRQLVEYDFDWMDDNTGPAGFAKRGISGLAVRKYDNTLCSYCSGSYNVALLALMSAFNGTPYPNIEFLSGKRMQATPGFDHTVLFGKCPINANKNNPDIKKALMVRGCPPDMEELTKKMAELGINIDLNAFNSFRAHMYKKSLQNPDYDMSLYRLE
ncbi:MAG: DUF362 domain-containing protein [Bacillota bacterium]